MIDYSTQMLEDWRIVVFAADTNSETIQTQNMIEIDRRVGDFKT